MALFAAVEPVAGADGLVEKLQEGLVGVGEAGEVGGGAAMEAAMEGRPVVWR